MSSYQPWFIEGLTRNSAKESAINIKDINMILSEIHRIFKKTIACGGFTISLPTSFQKWISNTCQEYFLCMMGYVIDSIAL